MHKAFDATALYLSGIDIYDTSRAGEEHQQPEVVLAKIGRIGQYLVSFFLSVSLLPSLPLCVSLPLWISHLS